MKRLKQKIRVDKLTSEIRPRRRGSVARWAYLGMLAALTVVIFDMVAGNLFYLKAEGMVSRDMAVVAPEYTGVVLDIPVEEGQSVQQGDVVARMRSQEMVRDLVRASAQLADLRARLSEMRIQRGNLMTLLPAAQDRAGVSATDRDRILSLANEGLLTTQRRAIAVNEAFSALQDLKRLETESKLIDSESGYVSLAVKHAAQALLELEGMYNKGVLHAPVDGTIGALSVPIGTVTREGGPVLEVFHGSHFVLAYVAIGTLYDVSPGDIVSLRYGLHTLPGTVVEILPMASRLPQEFQRAFETAQREQLIRIALPVGTPPPLFTKVNVTWKWAPSVLLSKTVVVLSALVEDETSKLYNKTTSAFKSARTIGVSLFDSPGKTVKPTRKKPAPKAGV